MTCKHLGCFITKARSHLQIVWFYFFLGPWRCQIWSSAAKIYCKYCFRAYQGDSNPSWQHLPDWITYFWPHSTNINHDQVIQSTPQVTANASIFREPQLSSSLPPTHLCSLFFFLSKWLVRAGDCERVIFVQSKSRDVPAAENRYAASLHQNHIKSQSIIHVQI